MVGGDVGPVLGAQEVLQQDLQGVREGLAALDLVEPEDLVGRVTDLQGVLGSEAVHTLLAHACSFHEGSLSRRRDNDLTVMS